MWSSRVKYFSIIGSRRLAINDRQSAIILRAEAEEFSAEARVVLGLMEVGQFVGGGFGADDFGELEFFVGRPASEVGDLRQDQGPVFQGNHLELSPVGEVDF